MLILYVQQNTSFGERFDLRMITLRISLVHQMLISFNRAIISIISMTELLAKMHVITLPDAEDIFQLETLLQNPNFLPRSEIKSNNQSVVFSYVCLLSHLLGYTSVTDY